MPGICEQDVWAQLEQERVETAWSRCLRRHFTSSPFCFLSNSLQLNFLSRLSSVCLKSLFHHLFSSHLLTHGSPAEHSWLSLHRDAKQQLFLPGPAANSSLSLRSASFPNILDANISLLSTHLCLCLEMCSFCIFPGFVVVSPRGQRSNKSFSERLCPKRQT